MIKKRGFEIFLVSILLIGNIFGGMSHGSNLAGKPTVNIYSDSQNMTSGKTHVCVQIHIDSNGTPLRALNVKLTYPSNFTLINFTSYKLLASSALEVGIPDTESDTGMIDYAQALPYGSTSIAINGTLAALCFTVPDTPGNYTLDIIEVALLDASGKSIANIAVTDDTITVACHIFQPDFNGDKCINILELIRIGQHWGETGDPYWIPEDVNCDGVVNILDIILVGQHWTG